MANNIKRILSAFGLGAVYNVETGAQLTGSFKIDPKDLEVLGSAMIYEQSNNGAGFVASTVVSLSTPASGVFTLGDAVNALYPGPSGNRDSGAVDGIPAEANYVTIEVTDVSVRYMIKKEITDNVQDYNLRDSGRTALSGDIIVLQSPQEIKNFVGVADSLAPLANPQTAMAFITFYNKKI